MGVLGLHPSWYINVNLVICHSSNIMRQAFSLLTPMLKSLLPLFILCSALLAGCGTALPSIKPFKMDIQQGNVVTSKMLLQLKPGMTKSQVRFIMGTPLIVDSFHKDRWDYFYQMRQAGKIVEQRRVILDFEKELLTTVRGDVVPQGASGAAEGAANSGADAGEANGLSAPIIVEPKPKESSLLDKLKFWKKDEKVIARPELMTPVAAAPVKTAAVAVPAVVAAVVEEAKPEMAKPEVANAAAEKSASEKSVTEKSWLDKLKFWKKNEPTAAETAALEDAKAETAAASAAKNAAQSEAPAAEAPSILAVPIVLPNAEAAKEQITKEAPAKIEPLRTEPYEAKTAPSITGKDSLKPLKSPSQKMLPAKPEYIKPVPEKPAVPSSVFNKPQPARPAPVDSQLSRPLKPLPLLPKKGEQLIFRMDKSLDLERGLAVNTQAMPEPATQAPDAMSKPIKAESEPLPVEAAPSFFDKMLEKIGF